MKSLETALPKAIPPLDGNPNDDPSIVKHIRSKNLVPCDIPNVRKYKFGDDHNGGIILFDTTDNAIGYYVRYCLVKICPDIKAMRQVLVWRAQPIEPGYIQRRGLASHIMFDELLPRYGQLICDIEQTSLGFYLWGRVMDTAIDNSIPCYIIFMPNSKKPEWAKHKEGTLVIQLHTGLDFKKYIPYIYGTGADKRYALLCVSQKPIPTGYYHRGEHIGEL